MGHSSKHDKSKHDKSKHGKSKRDGRKGTNSDITQLQALIANLEERQQSLARQHDEYSRLREQAETLQDRVEDAEQTLALLSSTSLAAQQARGVASMSNHPGQQLINQDSRRRHLLAEIGTLNDSINVFERRAEAMAELMARNQQEIENLQAQIRAAEEADAGWYGEQDGPDTGWEGGPGSGGGDNGGGSYGYYGGGQASSSSYYSHYASANT